MKDFWKVLGICSLWFSMLYMAWFGSTDKGLSQFGQGLFIGESSVFSVWAIKETIVHFVKGGRGEKDNKS